MKSTGALYLVGFMGAGKTTVGKRLAARLRCPFVDLDAEILRTTGREISEIFAGDGEDAFRKLESAALRALPADGVVVVATGGGLMTRDENVEWMHEHGTTCWIDPPFEVLDARLGRGGAAKRPLFADSEQARELWRARRPLYGRARSRVTVGPEDSADEVADRIVRVLEETT